MEGGLSCCVPHHESRSAPPHRDPAKLAPIVSQAFGRSMLIS